MKKIISIILISLALMVTVAGNVHAGTDVIYQTLPIFDERNLTVLQRKIIKLELGKRELSIGVPKEDYVGVQVYIEIKRVIKSDLPYIETKATILTEDDYFIAIIEKKEVDIESFFEMIKEAIIQAAEKAAD